MRLGRTAVMTPVIASTLSADDALSLETLRWHAGEADRYLLAPEGLPLDFDTAGFTVLRAPTDTLASVQAYNALMLSAPLYRAFAGYEALLIHQLDCLLLGPGLQGWAERGWSYLGAPWFGRDGRPKAIGNGGFSLRRPAHALAVLTSDRVHPRLSSAQRRQFGKAKHLGILLGGLAHAGRSGDRPLAERFVGGFLRPEDEFWSFYAPLFHRAYRVPAPHQAIGFAAESEPARVVALNGGALPLGCHAWRRHDVDFWRSALPFAAPP